MNKNWCIQCVYIGVYECSLTLNDQPIHLQCVFGGRVNNALIYMYTDLLHCTSNPICILLYVCKYFIYFFTCSTTQYYTLCAG